ncbi:MAG: ATP-dependent DNA helicase RecG [Candidatus Dojkabacteria bacterium]
MPIIRDSKITEIKGIGDKQAILFSKLGINTVEDLLFHIPFRYQDTSSIISIEEFKSLEKGTFLAKIEDVKTTYFRKKITTVKVSDETGSLRLTYFNQSYLQKTLVKGDIYLFDAKMTVKGTKKNIYNPKYEIFKYDPANQNHLGKMIGIYPETKGLSSRTIRNKIGTLKENIGEILTEPLNISDIEKENLITVNEAIRKIHFPEDSSSIQIAKERLSFDEMLKIGIKIEKERNKREKEKAKSVSIKSKDLNEFIKKLPYKLTKDQNSALEQILEDISTDKPMNRLLNGDVGSGKTVVAALAILNTIRNGFSCILIAPTTVLARQHYNTFKEFFNSSNIGVELCISSQKTISKMDNKLIIGTHAILYEKSLPKDLNLVVIDEQHRFGVEQREYFKSKTKLSPHYLTMTATPIPRSLTEIFFGGLDVSEIREKPSNRKEIKTYFTPQKKRASCLQWVREKIIESKHTDQAFIIYPLIEESEKLTSKSIMNEFDYLKDTFKGLKIEYLHGRLKEKKKNELLEKFRQKEINILISTTVIEVGIDIPDATIMIIEDAERFGLAQLHQLRGRVGRSNKESFCFVIPSDSVEKNSPSEDRLKYFASHNSGFEVAEYDLKSRGPGEVYGLRQSGIPTFKVADIHDRKLLEKARRFAKKLLKEDNGLKYILDNLFR